MKENEPKKFSRQKVPSFFFLFWSSSLRHHARTTILERIIFMRIKRFLSLFTRVVVMVFSFFKRDDVFERIHIKTLISKCGCSRARAFQNNLFALKKEIAKERERSAARRTN